MRTASLGPAALAWKNLTDRFGLGQDVDNPHSPGERLLNDLFVEGDGHVDASEGDATAEGGRCLLSLKAAVTCLWWRTERDSNPR